MTSITWSKNPNGLNTVGMEEYVDEREIEDMIAWIDAIPFSRPKVNMSKDFEDGVLMAELIKHYFPKMVELHNYHPASGTKQKLENWYLLNRRVLRRLNMDLSYDVIRALANGKRDVVHKILIFLRMQIDRLLSRQGRSRKEVDLEFMTHQQPSESEKSEKSEKSNAKDRSSPKESLKDSNSQALVPVSKSTDRSSPGKSPRKIYPKGDIPHTHTDRSLLEPLALPIERTSQAKSPRRIYTKGEIPHNHPDRSTYYGDKRMVPDNLPIYSYMYNHSHVPRLFMEEKELEIMQKDETIQMLSAKVRNMEHLLNLKQVRIEDLQSRLVGSRGVFYVSEGGRRKIVR